MDAPHPVAGPYCLHSLLTELGVGTFELSRSLMSP